MQEKGMKIAGNHGIDSKRGYAWLKSLDLEKMGNDNTVTPRLTVGLQYYRQDIF